MQVALLEAQVWKGRQMGGASPRPENAIGYVFMVIRLVVYAVVMYGVVVDRYGLFLRRCCRRVQVVCWRRRAVDMG